MTATLQLKREGIGIELRRGTFDVLIDNHTVRTINRHETIEVPIEPGHHTLRVRSGRYSSRELAFDASADTVINFRCHGAMVWPRYLASFLKPDLAFSLRRQ